MLYVNCQLSCCRDNNTKQNKTFFSCTWCIFCFLVSLFERNLFKRTQTIQRYNRPKGDKGSNFYPFVAIYTYKCCQIISSQIQIDKPKSNHQNKHQPSKIRKANKPRRSKATMTTYKLIHRFHVQRNMHVLSPLFIISFDFQLPPSYVKAYIESSLLLM